MSPGSLSFAKLVMMTFAPAKFVRDAKYASLQSPLQSVRGLHSLYVERKYSSACGTANLL